MAVWVDAHVHIYPFYDLPLFFSSALKNMQALSGDNTDYLLCLAERHDCHLFRQLKEGAVSLEAGGFTVQSCADEDVLCIKDENGQSLYLAAGRQIVTAERLEVLSLTSDQHIPDGRPVSEVVDRISENGALPVVAWAPGKWFFKRGRILRSLIDSSPAAGFLLGDSTLRPTVWMEPLLMRYARRKGFKVLAGSDPLPVAGEESKVASYGLEYDGRIDPEKPLASIRELLRNGKVSKIAGRRDSLPEVLKRLKKNSQSKRGAP